MNLLILMLGISACQPQFVDTTVPCPARPMLEALSQEEADAIEASVRRRIESNQVELKGYAKKLEKRAQCDKEAD